VKVFRNPQVTRRYESVAIVNSTSDGCTSVSWTHGTFGEPCSSTVSITFRSDTAQCSIRHTDGEVDVWTNAEALILAFRSRGQMRTNPEARIVPFGAEGR
jgi:hypothetical protein